MAHTAAEILCRDQFYSGQAGQRQTCRPGGASSTTTTNLSHQPHLINLISKKHYHQTQTLIHKPPITNISHQPSAITSNLSHQPNLLTSSTLYLISHQNTTTNYEYSSSATTITNISHQPHFITIINHQPFLRNYFHQTLPISHKP